MTIGCPSRVFDKEEIHDASGTHYDAQRRFGSA